MKKNIFVLAIMAISLVACNKESSFSNSPKHEELLGNGLKYIEIAITQEKPMEADTKATLAGVKMSFGVGDQIAVLATKNETTSKVTLTYLRYEDSKVVFGGTIDEDATVGNYAYYPASIATTTERTINWPTAVDGSKVQVPMVAYLDKEGNSATFKYLGAIAKITVASCPAGAKKLKFTAASNITGSYTVDDFKAGNPTATASSLSGKTITASISGNNTYYVPVPAGTYAGFQFALVDDDDTFYYKQKTAKSETSLTLGRTHIANMGTLTYDVDEVEEWYMVCKLQASAWDYSDHSVRYLKIGSNQYRVAINNGNDSGDWGYKVIDGSTISGWSDVYGQGDKAGDLKKGGSSNCAYNTANEVFASTITTNTSPKTYTTEYKAAADGYVYSDMKMVGDFNSWNKDTGGYSFTKTAAHNWRMTSSLTVSSNQKVEFKLITASQWDYGNWGGVNITDSTPYGTCTTRGSGSDPDTARSSYILTEGTYDVYFNDVTRDIMFVRVFP